MKSPGAGKWDFPAEVKVYFLLQPMWVANSSVFPLLFSVMLPTLLLWNFEVSFFNIDI